MRYIIAFLKFWYDVMVGDDWTIAASIAVAIALTCWPARSNIQAWWLALQPQLSRWASVSGVLREQNDRARAIPSTRRQPGVPAHSSGSTSPTDAGPTLARTVVVRVDDFPPRHHGVREVNSDDLSPMPTRLCCPSPRSARSTRRQRRQRSTGRGGYQLVDAR
jgi:hypothetical protein